MDLKSLYRHLVAGCNMNVFVAPELKTGEQKHLMFRYSLSESVSITRSRFDLRTRMSCDLDPSLSPPREGSHTGPLFFHSSVRKSGQELIIRGIRLELTIQLQPIGLGSEGHFTHILLFTQVTSSNMKIQLQTCSTDTLHVWHVWKHFMMQENHFKSSNMI